MPKLPIHSDVPQGSMGCKMNYSLRRGLWVKLSELAQMAADLTRETAVSSHRDIIIVKSLQVI